VPVLRRPTQTNFIAGPLAAIGLTTRHMITRFVFPIFLILITNIVTPQEVRYFNEKGPVKDSKHATYFETITKSSENQICSVKQKMNSDTLSYICYSSLSPLTRNGVTKIYYNSGKPQYIKNYKNNKLEGKTIRFYEDGKIESIITLAQDSVLSEKSFDKKGNEIKYLFDWVAPKYKNKTIDYFRNYLLSNISYPQRAIDRSISDKCNVAFIINENGNVIDIDVQTDIVPFKEEIVKAIQKTNGKWIPGERYGERFKSKFTMTINFNNNQ